MDSLRAWLCPTPAHRVRVVEASARIGKARIVIAGAIGAGVLLGAPWNGWWTLLLFVPTGGPDSPVLPWLVLVPAMATLRFRLAVSVALSGAAAALILAVGVGVDPARAWDDPVPMIAALVMVANIVGICTALMRGELEHRERAMIDLLTGLLNRGALESRVPELEQQARLTGGSVCLVLADLDHFKRVNDTHGHDRGNAALKEGAYAVRKALREFELAYRIGGEEFLVVLPGVGPQEGIEVGERVRARVGEARPAGLDLTVSVGVAAAAGDGVRYEELFRAADRALLRAKREGRDRVVAVPESRAAAPPAAAAA